MTSTVKARLVCAFLSVAIAMIMAIVSIGLVVRDGVVCHISGDIVTVEDNHGQLWDFYGDGFSQGDNVSLLMKTGFNENVYDDTIVIVRGE